MINNKQSSKKHHDSQSRSMRASRNGKLRLRTGVRAGGANFGDTLDLA